MSDEVGKVSLGLELVGGSDLNRQITMAAGAIGQQLTKSLQSTFGGFSLKGFASNISQTLKATTETAMRGIADGMEQSVAAVEARLVKSIDTASQAMKQSIEENKTAAEQAIDSISDKLAGLKAPSIFSRLVPNLQPAAAGAATPAVATPKTKTPKIDVEAAKAEMERLTAVLDNVNAKIEIQERKLGELRLAYAETFNEDKKNKLQEKIVNTEAALLRLTQTSDKTAKKIWELDDSIKNASEVADNAEKPVQNLGQKLVNTNKPIKQVKDNLNKAAKAAAGADKSFSSAGRSAGMMGNSFTRALGRILKQVFVFAVLYKAIRDFNSYLGSSLKTNTQFAASLNAIQTNLRVAFQPIYEAILPAINALMAGLAKITAYIAAFISALFGKTYQQSYQAAKGIETAKKAMEGYGKKAKKAGKDAKGALASFDELNTLDFSKNDTDADSGGGAKGFEMQMPDMDITGIQAKMDTLAANVKAAFDRAWGGVKQGWDWVVSTFGPSFQTAWSSISPELEKWKQQFGKMFNDVMALGEPLKSWFHEHLVPSWQNGIELVGHIWSGLLESIRNVVSSIWDAVFPIWEKLISEGLPRFTEFLNGVQEIFGKLFDLVKEIFDDIWRDAVDPAMKLVSNIIQDTLDIIFDWWDKWGKKIVDGLKESLDKIKELWNNIWENFLEPFISNMLDMLEWLWEEHLKDLVKEIGNFIGKLVTAAQDIFNKFIMPVINWLVKTLGPTWANMMSFIGDVIGTALGVISDVSKGIIKALGGVADFLAGVFTLDWKRAWEGIQTFMEGWKDALVGIFKGAVNLIIDALNYMIRQVNKVNIDVPEWVPGIGGKSLGFTVKEIPKLAKGGLAYGPTLAMVGDNKGAAADPEVISPLSTLQDMLSSSNQAVVDVLVMILDALRSGDKETVIKIGETEFGRLAARAIGHAERQAGRPLFAR